MTSFPRLSLCLLLVLTLTFAWLVTRPSDAAVWATIAAMVAFGVVRVRE